MPGRHDEIMLLEGSEGKCRCAPGARSERQKSEVVFPAALQTFCLSLGESLPCGSLQERECLTAVEVRAGQVLKKSLRS